MYGPVRTVLWADGGAAASSDPMNAGEFIPRSPYFVSLHTGYLLGNFKAGDVLVADITMPDWEPVMKVASAIVTNRGGRTCHAAIVSRELGVPAVIGCDNATTTIKNNTPVTVSCAEGDNGKVYEGILNFEIKTTDLTGLKRPRT